MLKYCGTIIKNAREDARQELATDVVGDQVISTNALVRYCNYAIERITHIVLTSNLRGSTFFERQADLAVTLDQQAYEIDDNVYLKERYKNISISSNVQVGWWRELREVEISYLNYNKGWPAEYVRSQGKLLLSPTPDRTEGYLRVVYDRAPDRIDVRRALVTSATGTPLTSITLNNGTFPTDTDAFEDEPYCCVVDSYGVVKAYNIPITSITTTTITVPSHTLASGESISAGNYVVPGKYTTTHANLPLICEKYITQYLVVKAFRKESSTDEKSANSELAAMESEILEAFMNTNRDQIEIQRERGDILLGNEW